MQYLRALVRCGRFNVRECGIQLHCTQRRHIFCNVLNIGSYSQSLFLALHFPLVNVTLFNPIFQISDSVSLISDCANAQSDFELYCPHTAYQLAGQDLGLIYDCIQTLCSSGLTCTSASDMELHCPLKCRICSHCQCASSSSSSRHANT